jgi:hypothetical protein
VFAFTWGFVENREPRALNKRLIFTQVFTEGTRQ